MPRRRIWLYLSQSLLRKKSEIAFVRMKISDVVRHPLVQKIVKAYEDYENRLENRTTSRKGGSIRPKTR